MRVRAQGLCLLLVLFLAACTGSRPAVPDFDGPRFSEDVLPMLNQFQAYSADLPGLQLDSWSSLMAGSQQGAAVIPFDAANSPLVKLAENKSVAGGPSAAQVELLKAWIDNGARNDRGEVPFADAEHLLYVCNQADATISVIDMETNLIIRTVDLKPLGFSANARPHHIAVEDDGSAWYVSLIGESKVLKFNRDNELLGFAEFETPGMLALHPTNNELWVGRSMMAANPPQRVGVIERDRMTIDEVEVFFPRPHALVIRPEGDYAYTASLAENRLASVSIEDEEVGAMQSVEGAIHTFVQFAITPDGQTMVVGGQLTGTLFIFDLSNPESPTLVDSMDVNAAPWHPVITPDGRYVYFGNKMANTVTVVDLQARRVVKVIEGQGISQPHGSAVSPDGRYVYISNSNLKGAYTPRHSFDEGLGTVVVIDTRTNEIAQVIEVGHYASGLGARIPR